MSTAPLPNGETCYWICPHGEFHTVEDGTHEDYAADVICPDEANQARDDYPEWDMEDSGGQEEFRGAVFSAAYAERWVDAHVEGKIKVLWLREGDLDSMTHEARESVKDFAIEHGLAVSKDSWKGAAGLVLFDARAPAAIGSLSAAPPSAASESLFQRAVSGK